MNHIESRENRRRDLASGVSSSHVEEAIAEWDRVGRDSFLHRYSASRAQRYVLVRGAKEYDAKALLHAAAQFAGTWDPDANYRGDRGSVAEPLMRLGFEIHEV
ncbi:MAG TPA: hypothetical protein GX718_06955 [Brevibacterium sp.]|nr:hypothetical protein [Brevibacterium sp.]